MIALAAFVERILLSHSIRGLNSSLERALCLYSILLRVCSQFLNLLFHMCLEVVQLLLERGLRRTLLAEPARVLLERGFCGRASLVTVATIIAHCTKRFFCT